MKRLSILQKPIKNLIYNTMPIVIDNIDKYILTMKDNALTITLKTFDFEKEQHKKQADNKKKRDIFNELNIDAQNIILQALIGWILVSLLYVRNEYKGQLK